MARKCSHCGYMGHNSRTCNTNMARGFLEGGCGGGGGGLKLFGVQMISNDVAPSSLSMIRKSFSMDCLSPSSTTSPISSSSSSANSSTTTNNTSSKTKLSSNGYISDGLPNQERKKGVPWTEEEHRVFLIGLEKLGKGDWRGISRNFVTTRTPTQVASHAQKYFLRQNSLRNKRRPSLFDADLTGKFQNQTEASMSWEDISRRRRYGGSSIDFNFSTEGQNCKITQPPDPVWLRDSFCSTTPDLTKSTSSVYNSSAPDLELTLAAPRPLKQKKTSTSNNNKSSSGANQLLLGPIRVV